MDCVDNFIRFLQYYHLIAALSDKEKANGGHSQDTDADQYFEFLELACQTRQPRLMEIALNAIHFLVGKSQCNVIILQYYV